MPLMCEVPFAWHTKSDTVSQLLKRHQHEVERLTGGCNRWLAQGPETCQAAVTIDA